MMRARISLVKKHSPGELFILDLPAFPSHLEHFSDYGLPARTLLSFIKLLEKRNSQSKTDRSE